MAILGCKLFFDKYKGPLCDGKYCTCFPPPSHRERVWVLADFSFTLNRFLSVKIVLQGHGKYDPDWCFVHGRFVPTDVLSAGRYVRRTFCPHGCFVRQTFCRYGCFVPTDVLSLRTFCPRTFCLWTFCLRTFCLGRAPKKNPPIYLYVEIFSQWNFQELKIDQSESVKPRLKHCLFMCDTWTVQS
jgi:hypothetical protein